MPEDPLAKYKTKNVGDPLAKYKAPAEISPRQAGVENLETMVETGRPVRPEYQGKWGGTPEYPLEEEGTGVMERIAHKYYAPSNIYNQLEWFRRKPGVEGKPAYYSDLFGLVKEPSRKYQAKAINGKIVLRPQGSREPWRVIDPDTGFISKDLPSDIIDAYPELLGMAAGPTKPLAIGASIAGGEALGSIIGKEKYGFKTTPGEIAESAAEKGLTTAMVGGALHLAPEVVAPIVRTLGKGLQAPGKGLEKITKEKAREALNKEAGELSIEAQKLQNLRTEAKEAKGILSKESRDLLENIKSGRETIEKQAEINKSNARIRQAQEKIAASEEKEVVQAGLKSRTAEEASQLQQANVAAREFQIKASEMRKKGKEILDNTKGIEGEQAEAQREIAHGYYKKAQEFKDKAEEVRTRSGLFKLSQKERAAQEAKQGVEKLPPVQEGTSLNKPSQVIKTTNRAEDERLIGNIFSNAHRETFKINENWADQRFDLGDLRADGIISRQEHRVLGKEFAKDAKELRENIWNYAYRDVIDILKKQGLSEVEATERAGIARQTAEVHQALGRFSKADYSKTASGIMFGRIKKDRISEVLRKIKELPANKKLSDLQEEILKREKGLGAKQLAYKEKAPLIKKETELGKLLKSNLTRSLVGMAAGGAFGGFSGSIAGGLMGSAAKLGIQGLEKGGVALEKLANRISAMPPEAKREFLLKFPAIKAALYGLRVSP